MSCDKYFYEPTPEDERLFKQVIEAVRRAPQKFVEAGRALDQNYSTQATRDRKAQELRQHRQQPGSCRLSRAYRRKEHVHLISTGQSKEQLSPTQVAPRPHRRERGADGKLKRPEIPLLERFQAAWWNTFEGQPHPRVMTDERCHEVATRRVLLAWLLLHPSRNRVERITVFQDLRTDPTDDGWPRLCVSDDNEPPDFSTTLFVDTDGALDPDACEWIPQVEDAINTLDALNQQNERSVPLELEVHEKQESDSQADWRDVQVRLLRLRNAGDACTSQRELAKLMKCSLGTISKAIKKSAILKGWASRRGDGSPRAQSLNELVGDNAENDREIDPSDAYVGDDEVDRIMGELIEQAQPSEQAKLNKLDAEDRQKLVREYLAQRHDEQIENGPNHVYGRKP